MKEVESAANALTAVMDALPGEEALLVCDPEKSEVAEIFARGALSLGLWTRVLTLECGAEFRTEVPAAVSEALRGHSYDLCFNFLRSNLEEVPFRIALVRQETRRRVRLGHCPGVDRSMLSAGALALTKEEHAKMAAEAGRLIAALAGAVFAHLTTPQGTDLTLSLAGREFFSDVAFDWRTWKWMNLPTGEITIGPREDSLEGKLVCDLGIGGIGPIAGPLTITAKNGRFTEISGDDPELLARVRRALTIDHWAGAIGEFALGINPRARLSREFLEMEKVRGTVHLAFGHNLDYKGGGENPSAGHLDFLTGEPTVEIERGDGSRFLLVEAGRIMET